ncbi:helix-turn-helix domain-containing protein [Pluralibacter gergoviae]
MERDSSIKVIIKAIDILKMLSKNINGLLLAEISQNLNLPRTTVHRIISTLESQGFISHVNGKLKLGNGFFLLLQNTNMTALSYFNPFLKELSSTVKESVSLSTLHQNKLHVIDCIIYEKDLRVSFPVGLESPCYATAAGKMLLSDLSDDLLELAVPRQTVNSEGESIDRASLIEDVKTARENGFSIDENVYIEGVTSFSVLIKTAFGVYSITVLAPSVRVKDGRDAILKNLFLIKEKMEK